MRCLMLVGVAILAAAAVLGCSSTSRLDELCAAADREVAARLKAPSTATFQDCEERAIREYAAEDVLPTIIWAGPEDGGSSTKDNGIENLIARGSAFSRPFEYDPRISAAENAAIEKAITGVQARRTAQNKIVQTIRDGGRPLFVLLQHVDSQNSFGAQVRTTIRIVMYQESPPAWRAAYVDVFAE